jgi:hypothetical protein
MSKRKLLGVELDPLPKNSVVVSTSTTKVERSDLDRLLRLVITTVRRAGKVAKSQEILKVVKRLKKQKSQHEKLVVVLTEETSASTETALLDKQQQQQQVVKVIQKSQKKIESLERRLNQVKQMEMDMLLKVCMRRLGLKLLGVDIDAEASRLSSLKNKISTDDTPAIGSEIMDDVGEQQQQQQQIVETLLLHKNLSTTMDNLNKKITEYRRQLLVRTSGEGDITAGDRPIVYRRDRKKARQQQQQQHPQQQWSKINKSKNLTHVGPGSMFVESLSGEPSSPLPENTTHAQFSHYGPGANDLLFTAEKKNRPGQRARRAKAIVQQAKKEGREWDTSVNWREPKPKKKTKQNTETEPSVGEKEIANTSIKATDIALMGKDWKADGKAHPSWLAAKARQTHGGMTEFKGKKITF